MMPRTSAVTIQAALCVSLACGAMFQPFQVIRDKPQVNFTETVGTQHPRVGELMKIVSGKVQGVTLGVKTKVLEVESLLENMVAHAGTGVHDAFFRGGSGKRSAEPVGLHQEAREESEPVLPQHYIAAGSGTNSCPKNFIPVATAAACSRASKSGLSGVSEHGLGKHQFDVEIEQNSTNWPSGCYKNNETNVLSFNSIPDTSYATFEEVDPATSFLKICSRWEQECDMTNQLVLLPQSMAYSNLAGKGPDVQAFYQMDMQTHGVKYNNVFPYHNGKNIPRVDLLVTVANGNYNPNNISKNGLHGLFGQVNLKVGTNVTLNFTFLDNATGETALLKHSFFVSFWDLDQEAHTKAQERIRVVGYTSFNKDGNSEVEVIDNDLFTSTKKGRFEDNPRDPCVLPEGSLQSARHVVFKLPPTHTFLVNMAVADSQDDSGRNILFTGASTTACPINPYCTYRDIPGFPKR